MIHDSRLDILRLISIFAVVMIHITAPYTIKNSIQINQFDTWLVEMINNSLFWCVPVFFMLSGVLLLNKGNESMSTFYKKRMRKVLLPTAFWSAIFLLYLYVARDFTVFNMAGALLKGKPFYHLWFMFAIIGLYVFVPYLRILLDNLTDVQTGWLIFFTFFFSVGHNYLAFYLGNQSTIFSSFLAYVGYFILGCELYKYKDNAAKHRSLLLMGFILSVLITSVVNIVFKGIILIKLPIIAYYSPFITFQAVTLFLYVIGSDSSVKSSKVLIELSVLSFGVYLIHPLFIIALEPQMTMDRLYMFPLFYLLVLSSSYLIVKLMSHIKYIKAFI